MGAFARGIFSVPPLVNELPETWESFYYVWALICAAVFLPRLLSWPLHYRGAYLLGLGAILRARVFVSQSRMCGCFYVMENRFLGMCDVSRTHASRPNRT